MDQVNKHIIDELEHAPIPVPSDSYFEALKKNVLREIKNEGSEEEKALLLKTETSLDKSKKTRIIPMYQRWYVWGSAAAILAFLFLSPWNDANSPAPVETVNLSSVSNEEIYNYLAENIEDVDAETIALHLNNETLTEPKIEKSTSKSQNQEEFSSKSPLLENVKDQEILDYLKDDPNIYRDGELDEYLLIES